MFKWLMPKETIHPWVYIIGDKPSEKNISKSVPFVGTKSYKTMLTWLADMHIDVTRVKMYNQSDNPFDKEANVFLNKGVNEHRIKIISVGKEALKYLVEMGIEDFFALPHPSGLNRANNNVKLLNENLDKCRKYIYGEEDIVETETEA